VFRTLATPTMSGSPAESSCINPRRESVPAVTERIFQTVLPGGMRSSESACAEPKRYRRRARRRKRNAAVMRRAELRTDAGERRAARYVLAMQRPRVRDLVVELRQRQPAHVGKDVEDVRLWRLIAVDVSPNCARLQPIVNRD
jgi:hypothetical protein